MEKVANGVRQLNRRMDAPISMRSVAPPSLKLGASKDQAPALQKSGEGTPSAELPGKIFTSMFRDGQAGASFEAEIFVDQPGKGGDQDSWEYTGEKFDVGHTYMRLVRRNEAGIVTAESVIGFYPRTNINPMLGRNVAPGTVQADDGGPFDVKYTLPLTEDNFFKVLDYVEANANRTYDLRTYNCTDFVIEALAAGGQSLPDNLGHWPGGSGSNPGRFGADLELRQFWEAINPAEVERMEEQYGDKKK